MAENDFLARAPPGIERPHGGYKTASAAGPASSDEVREAEVLPKIVPHSSRLGPVRGAEFAIASGCTHKERDRRRALSESFSIPNLKLYNCIRPMRRNVFASTVSGYSPVCC